MLNKLLDYFDNTKRRPWLKEERQLNYSLGWNDYKMGRQPCCGEEYIGYHKGYARAKADTENKLNWVDPLIEKIKEKLC